MKDKRQGFSLVELLVVTAISILIFAGIIGVFILGKNTWTIGGAQADLQQQGRVAMENMSRELSHAAYDGLNWPKINDRGALGNEILFQIPVRNNDPVAYTMYSDTGTLKLGADGRRNAAVILYVDNQHNLIRKASYCETFKTCGGDGEPIDTSWNINTRMGVTRNQKSEHWLITLGFKLLCPEMAYADTQCNGKNGCEPQLGETCINCPGDCGECPPAYCGNGLCETGETCLNCLECCPDTLSGPCENIQCWESYKTLASNVNKVNFTLLSANTIGMRLELQKKTLGNQTVSLVLKSQATLRNTLSEKKAVVPPVLNEAGGNFDRYTSDGYVVYNKPSFDLVGKGCGDDVCDTGENRNNCPADCHCGDGTCNYGENKTSCFTDCHCGDGICNAGENNSSCPADCKCGNGICEPQYGETINTCSRDCKCGNGTCEAQYNETYATCSADCKCGNGTCEAQYNETYATCPADCKCGNGVCEDSESLNTCFADCHCGDFLCNAGETYSTCPGDCKCGNGTCEPVLGENCSNCSGDCGKCPPETQPPCFLAGTPILMADGKTLPIEQIKVGDKITSYDEAGKKFVKDKVKKVLRHTAEEYLIINGHLKVTPNHSFYSDGKWQHIGSLKVGDNLFTSEGKIEKIREIKKIKAKIEVYNFEVNPYKTYIAGGCVVHNAFKDPIAVY